MSPVLKQPYAGANHHFYVSKRTQLLPFPFVCTLCGTFLIHGANVRSYYIRTSLYLCSICASMTSHNAYLRHRQHILMRDIIRYHRLKQNSLLAPGRLRQKLRYLRAVVAGGVDKITGGEELRCGHCGCDDVLYLEVNHRNGGGAEEGRHRGHAKSLGQAILEGRPVVDLDILCGPCNRLEYLKRRFPGRKYPEVVWNPGPPSML